MQAGNTVAQRGYWGDIVNSPYLAFGVESENKELFETVNGKPAKTSVGVSEWNLLSLVQSLTTGERAGGGDIGKERDLGPGKSSGGLGAIRELSDEEGEEGEVSSSLSWLVMRTLGSHFPASTLGSWYIYKIASAILETVATHSACQPPL